MPRTTKPFSRLLLSCLLLAAGLPGPAAAHEIVLIPTKVGDRSFPLPVVTPGAHLSVSPASLSFGNVDVGDSSTRTLTVSNVGAEPVTVTFEPPVGEIAVSPASLTLNPQGTAGSGASVTVTWSPDFPGPLTGTLAAGASHPGVGVPARSPVAVSGTATSVISISPSALDFGVVDSNAGATETLTVSNVSAAPVSVSILASSWEIASIVPSTAQTLGAAGSPTASRTYTVTFDTNGQEKTFSGHLTVTPTTGTPAGHVVPVTAQAVDLGGVGGVFTDSSGIFFGVVRPGAAVTRNVWLHNPSQAHGVDVTLAVSGSPAVAVSPQQLAIPPGQTAQVAVSWTPSGNGALSASLTATAIYDGVPGPVVRTKAVEGYSRDFPALPSAFAFGTVGVGQAGSIPVSLSNPSALPLTVEFPAGGEFSLVPNDQSLGQTDVFGISHPSHITLGPGQSRTVDFVWSPSSLAALEQAMEFRVWYPDTTRFTFLEPLLEVLWVSGTPVPAPQLELLINGAPADSFDFGRVSRRPYLDTADAPFFDLELHNSGAIATEVSIPGQIIVGCNSEPMTLCVSDEGGLPPPFEVPAGGSRIVRWHLFASDVGPLARTLTFNVLGGDPVEFEITAEGVPYLVGFDGGTVGQAGAPVQSSAPLQSGSAAATAVPNQGTNIDPFASDPLATYRPTGFDARGLFAVGDFDNVDLRSGNLVLTIPILSHHVRGGLGYGLSAVYNSNIWARRSAYDRYADQTLPGPPLAPENAEFPNPGNNTGMGWSVHLGRLRPPFGFTGLYEDLERELEVETGGYWAYIDPSGAMHTFHHNLNGAVNPHGLNGTTALDVRYARDGSHLRLKVVGEKLHVEFPDGDYHVFGYYDQLTPSHPDHWRLEEIRDRFDNVVTIQYPEDGLTWVICDPFRITAVAFEEADHPDTKHYKASVSSIKTARHPEGGNRTQCEAASAAQVDRTWTFSWQEVTLVRPRDTYPDNTPTVTVPILDSITLPDATSWGFSYHQESGQDSQTKALRLHMKEASLPTGGSVHWEYTHLIPDVAPGDCWPDSGGGIPSVGVTRRYALDAGAGSNATPLADTRYLRWLADHKADLPDGEFNACREYTPDALFKPNGLPNYSFQTPSPELRVHVWTQLEPGKSSVDLRYFSVWPFLPYSGSDVGWDRRELGLNLTRRFPPDDDGRYLANRLYRCSSDVSSSAAVLSDLLESTACTQEEQTWVKYELPASDVCEGYGGPPCHVGVRLVESETLYLTDRINTTPRSATVVHSNYDGLGHYRQTVTGGNFNSGNAVTTFQNWNKGRGELVLDANGRVVGKDVTYPDPWILDTYREKWVEEGGVTQGGEAVFDLANGWMRLERTWAGGAAGPKDLVVRYAHNAQGELDLQRYFGADTYSGAGLTASDWDAVNKEGTYWTVSKQDYSVEYQYEHGVLSRQRVAPQPATANQPVYEVWRTIDEVTGRVAEETLNRGEELTYTYDPMGRVTAIDSDVAADREFEYTKPSSSTTGTWQLLARTYRKGDGSAGGDTPLAEYEAVYDGLGRVSVERIEHPSGTPSEQITTYHPSGLVASRTLPNEPANSIAARYDFKGRVLSVNKPDGTQVEYVYKGVRERQTRANVGPGSAVIGVTKVEWDRQGRTFQVKRGRLAGGDVAQPPLNVTTYAYDPQGRVTKAERGEQDRTMTYDGRGFLLSEQIPERATLVEYTNFNTRGQARTVEHEAAGLVKRSATQVFDDLGRPTELTIDGDLIKSWTYHACDLAGTAGGDLGNCPGGNGQVDVALRLNYRTNDGTDDGTGGVICSAAYPCDRARFPVEYTYVYDDAGRVASRRTDVRYLRLDEPSGSVIPGGTTVSGRFHQLWAYEDTGWVTRTDYPAFCTGPNVGSCGSARQVDYLYRDGFLTQVDEPNLGASLEYNPDGSIRKVIHLSGGTDTYDPDPSGLSRVGTTTLAGGSLTLGPYAYDASGNVLSIGGIDDTFSYDAASRLTGATLQGGAHTYSYAYDEYDNLQWGTVAPATSHWTGGGNDYDDFGNWKRATTASGVQMRYDALDKITAMFDNATAVTSCNGTSANCTLSIYDTGDLRILEFRHGQGPWTWTIRDLDGKVLTELTDTAIEPSELGAPLRKRDYVYAGSRLISSRQELGEIRVRHYHLDHLGTPRVVTSQGFQTETEFAHYSPYGVEIPSQQFPADETVAGFTGHEKDGAGAFATNSMRARQYLPLGGRFMQVDPGRDSGSWSLYAYANNNPLRYLDINGLWSVDAHWVMTWSAAVINGFNEDQAKEIANASVAVDEADSSTPFRLSDLTDRDNHREDFHFPSKKRLGELRGAAQASPFEETGDPGEGRTAIGDFMHAVQDSVAHQVDGQGFPNDHYTKGLRDKKGRLWQGAEVDDPTLRRKEAADSLRYSAGAIRAIFGTTPATVTSGIVSSYHDALRAAPNSEARREALRKIAESIELQRKNRSQQEQ
jgi:RHS repeat-associated protein